VSPANFLNRVPASGSTGQGRSLCRGDERDVLEACWGTSDRFMYEDIGKCYTVAAVCGLEAEPVIVTFVICSTGILGCYKHVITVILRH
jgi:hypothetical protein